MGIEPDIYVINRGREILRGDEITSLNRSFKEALNIFSGHFPTDDSAVITEDYSSGIIQVLRVNVFIRGFCGEVSPGQHRVDSSWPLIRAVMVYLMDKMVDAEIWLVANNEKQRVTALYIEEYDRYWLDQYEPYRDVL